MFDQTKPREGPVLLTIVTMIAALSASAGAGALAGVFDDAPDEIAALQ
jgi:hypothetical protein